MLTPYFEHYHLATGFNLGENVQKRKKNQSMVDLHRRKKLVFPHVINNYDCTYCGSSISVQQFWKCLKSNYDAILYI